MINFILCIDYRNSKKELYKGKNQQMKLKGVEKMKSGVL